MRLPATKSEKISPNITMYEAIKSNKAIKLCINNTPNDVQLANMKKLALKLFQPLRRGLGNHPINIDSFFRCYNLNASVGGARRSQHMALNGAAMDIDVDGSEHFYNCNIFDFIKENLLFDQLIWEFGDDENPAWVHVSFNEGYNRKQILIAYKVGKKTKYRNYDRD